MDALGNLTGNMKRNYTLLSLFVLFLITMVSCEKETEIINEPTASEYVTLEKGKYIIYELDSTIFINFGQEDTVIRYEAKDMVDEEITDNLQRPAFRIIRSIRNAGSTNENDWKPVMTYMIVQAGNNIEVVENNLRYLKLVSPVREGYTWKANTFLPSKPFEAGYSFSVDEDIQYWESMYENVGQPLDINGLHLDNTLTIRQVEDSVNVPVEIPDSYGYKIVWNEQYAQGIGMVSKNVEMWEYQPPTSGQPGFRTGFAISMRIKSHN